MSGKGERDVVLEVCCEASVENVINAFRGGAHRVELCSSLLQGGTTPSIGAVVSIARPVPNTHTHTHNNR